MARYNSFDRTPDLGEGYPMYFFSGGSHDPAASTRYYFGAVPFVPHTQVFAPYRAIVPLGGSVRWFSLTVHIFTGLATAELGSFGVRINTTTDYTLGSAVSWAGGQNSYQAEHELGIFPISRCDVIEAWVDTPAWVTAPQGVAYSAVMWCEPRAVAAGL